MSPSHLIALGEALLVAALANGRNPRGLRTAILGCICVVTGSFLGLDGVYKDSDRAYLQRTEILARTEVPANAVEEMSRGLVGPSGQLIVGAVGVAGTTGSYSLRIPGLLGASGIEFKDLRLESYGRASLAMTVPPGGADAAIVFEGLSFGTAPEAMMSGKSENRFSRASGGPFKVSLSGAAFDLASVRGAMGDGFEALLNNTPGDLAPFSPFDSFSELTMISHREFVFANVVGIGYGSGYQNPVINEAVNLPPSIEISAGGPPVSRAINYGTGALGNSFALVANNASAGFIGLTSQSAGGGGIAPARSSPNAPLAIAYWDTNGATAGPGGSGAPNGTWSTSVANWNPVADGTGTTAVWHNGDDAVFSAAAAGNGNTANKNYSVTVSGPVTANSITVKDASKFELDGTANPVLTVGPGGVTLNNTLPDTITFDTSLGTVFLSASQTWTNDSSANFVVESNLAAVGGPVTLTIDGRNGTGGETFSGVLSDGTGKLSLNLMTFNSNRGAKFPTLSAVNTYSGDTTITLGTLILGVSGAIPSGPGKGNVIITADGILDTGDKDHTINGLFGSGVINQNGGNTRTLSVGANDTSSFFSGNISHTGGGKLGLTKVGTGALTLTGINVYNGNTTVNAGTLEIANDGSTTHGALTTTGQITINSGATLLLSGFGNHPQINDTAKIILAGGTFTKGTNVSEGSTSVDGLGALSLTGAGSKIDYSFNMGVLSFASFDPKNFVLTIVNYTGNGSPGGVNELIFSQDQSRAVSSFDFGFGPGVNVAQQSVGPGFFEVYSTVAIIPEPGSTSAFLLGAVLLLSAQRAMRLRKL